MLYHVYSFFSCYVSVNLRIMASFFTAFVCALMGGHYFMSLSKHTLWSSAREYAPITHKKKGTVPSMGGLFILFAVIVSLVCWATAHASIILFVLCILLFGAIGFWDDWFKLTRKKGIKAAYKCIAQIGAAIIMSVLLVYCGVVEPVIVVPWFKSAGVFVGPFFIIWAAFIFVACSNAVNLTDGLDGLAAGSLLPNYLLFTSIFYAHHAEMVIAGACLMGAVLGFLWYNSYPAQVFMGDVGSLSLGAALAYMALVSKYELLLVISGGLFVVETLSVIVQVVSYTYFKKRVFAMAPLHHHFELHGTPEPKIVARCTIISWVFVLSALSLFISLGNY